MTALDTFSWMPRKKLPPSEKKVPVAGRIDPSLMDGLTRLAEDDDRTVSYMLEKAVRLLLENQPGAIALERMAKTVRKAKPPRR